MLVRSPKELALLVAKQRKKRGLSQEEAGKLVGVKQQTISDFERNPEATKLTTLFHILSAVNLDIKVIGKDESSEDEWKEEW